VLFFVLKCCRSLRTRLSQPGKTFSAEINIVSRQKPYLALRTIDGVLVVNRIDEKKDDTSADVSRMSMWTVVGAVAASVATAGILGSVSGILQIPAVVTDVATLRASRDDAVTRLSSMSERLRSQELVDENLQRQVNQLSQRIDQMSTRLDARDQEARTSDITLQRQISELDTRVSRGLSETEGRSKDRNTEAMGAVNALQTGLASLGDRQKATAAALNVIQQNIYDLATRASRPEAQSNQRSQEPPGTKPYQQSPMQHPNSYWPFLEDWPAHYVLTVGACRLLNTDATGAAVSVKQEAGVSSKVR
jgi:uncharacterized phage infection (PIP) family protein YhgE